MSARSCPPSRRAFTLLEVLVASALLAMVLTAMLLAMVRFDRQTRQAQLQVDAAAAAETLLAAWWQSPNHWPVGRQGPVPDRPAWRWRTTESSAPGLLADLAVRLGRLEVLDDRGQVLSRVELLLPPLQEKSLATQPAQPGAS